ncbi:zinc-binding dehydrogenase [Chryseobacterium sp. 09-1422]|uniref:Zinc-binding dehydrogenase n=1 Tax=Chryseobacterium kimseyorum TaxID=2984028 RepID=A0ABT3I3S3_9FLAO|nr:zinc-binding dehydrogenase [Chryseobacterium kimseyorum]MCW3170668.1 zinc-binding dehydrogenase [Chryseobacterium kimseyorum]
MENKLMRSWQADEFGEISEVLKIKNIPVPEPKKGEALIKVIVSSIGLPDKLAVEGNYPFVTNPPITPGQEFVGIVEKTGADFPFIEGTKVLGTSEYYGKGYGAVADYTICSKTTVLPFPTKLSDEQAAAFPGTYHVAYVGLVNRGDIKDGDSLLVLGAAGRTGAAALQLGKALGAKVIAVIRNDEQKEFCISQGADVVLNSSDEKLIDKIMELTDHKGVDVIYDTVGGKAHKSVINAIAYKGRVILVGFAGGSWPELNPQHIMFKGYAVMGALNTIRTEEEKQDAIKKLSELIGRGDINPPKAKLFNFNDTISAMSEIGKSKEGIVVQLS